MDEHFSARLKEERKRLGLTQEEMAELGGVKKLSQLQYEKSDRLPALEYIAALSHNEKRIDIGYLLTGNRNSMPVEMLPNAQPTGVIDEWIISWLEQASEDMRCSLAVFECGGWSNSALLAQQCAEKMAKAMLIYAGKDLPSTSNMGKLTDLLVDADLIKNKADFVESCQFLNQVFSMSRYPQLGLNEAPYKAFSRTQAELAIEYGLVFYDLAMRVFGDEVNPVLLERRGAIGLLWEGLRCDDGADQRC